MQKWQKKVVAVLVLIGVSSAHAMESCDDILANIQSELTLYVSRRSTDVSQKKSIQDIYEQVIQKRVQKESALLDRCPKLRTLLSIVEAAKRVKSDTTLAGNGTERGGNGTERGGNGTERGGNGTERGGNGTERGGNGTERGGNGTERGGNGTERGGNGTERGGNGTERGGNGTERGLMGFFGRVFGGRPQNTKMQIVSNSRRSAQIDQATALLSLAAVSPESQSMNWGLSERDAFNFEFEEKIRRLSLGEILGRSVFETMLDRNEIAPVAVVVRVRLAFEESSCSSQFMPRLETEVQDLNRGLRAGFDIASRASNPVGVMQYMNSVLEILREGESRLLEIRQNQCPGSKIVSVRFESAANPAPNASGVERE